MRISGEVVSSDQKMTVADKGEGETYLSKSVVEFFKYKVCLCVRIIPSYPLFPQFPFIYARSPVLSTMLNCIIMLSRLLR